MPVKTKQPRRPKTKCQYVEERWNAVRFLRHIEGEFTCPGCGSVLKKGRVFYCDICAMELGPCCFDHSGTNHNHQADVPGHLRDYLPPDPCSGEGRSRCMCCERMLCVGHSRKADVSHQSLKHFTGERLSKVVLCPSCKETLDPVPEDERPERDDGREPYGFTDESELRRYLRQTIHG